VAISRALRRLLRIRELEEEQCRIALESAIGDLNRLQHALAANLERDRRGRLLVQSSAVSGELRDRLAGMEETRAAERLARVLAPRIADAEQDVVILREEFLDKRVERRQAETLIEEAGARDALDAERRSQTALDEWFGNRRHRAGRENARTRVPGSRTSARETGPQPGSAGSEET
jgi:flagellar biosynthesis chaperone FliJ